MGTGEDRHIILQIIIQHILSILRLKIKQDMNAWRSKICIKNGNSFPLKGKSDRKICSEI